eukprot:6213127-Pleurochrysis_carterae.AAC.1
MQSPPTIHPQSVCAIAHVSWRSLALRHLTRCFCLVLSLATVAHNRAASTPQALAPHRCTA